MKFNNSISIIFLLIIMGSYETRAQASGSIFSGIFDYKTKNVPDSLVVSTLHEANAWGDLTTFFVPITSGKKFKFSLPEIKKPTILILKTISARKFTLLGQYYALPGDNIQLQILEGLNKDSILFTGQGAAKYNLSEKLNGQYALFQQSRITDLTSPLKPSPIELGSYLDRFSLFVKKWSDHKTQLINEYRDVAPEIKTLISYQYAPYFETWTTTLDYYCRQEDLASPEFKAQIRGKFNAYSSLLWFKPDTLSVLAPFYYTGLAFRIKTSLLANEGKPSISLTGYYDALEKYTDGIIRERLLTEFFTSNYTMENLYGYQPEVFDSLVVEALKSVKKPFYRSLIGEKTKTSRGSKIYQAIFTTQTDKSFSLESLLGSVVLVDVWATGCGGCAEFHRKFEKDIYPAFRQHKDFVFLSVNADRTKERWLAGLNSGIYSSKDYLNVSTGTSGQNHPFFKFYTNALPLLLLVGKDGRIVSKIRGSERSEDLIQMIRTALNQPSK